MSKLELKEIDIWPVAKISFLVFGISGLFMGLFYFMIIMMGISSLFSMFNDADIPGISGVLPGVIGFFVCLMMSFFTAIFGSIYTCIFVYFYNVFAGFFGGITFSLEEKHQKNSEPANQIADTEYE